MTLMMVLFKGFFYYFNPQILEGIIAENEKIVLKEGNYTLAEVKNNSEQLRKIFMPMTLSLTTVTYLVFGAVTAVITGLVLRSARKN